MKLSIFGSCSGTEPFENRHHTAHLMGLDLLRVSDIFISHPHMNHVGGLANLLWTIRKLSKVKKEQPRYGDLHVYIPSKKTWDGIFSILEESKDKRIVFSGDVKELSELSPWLRDGCDLLLMETGHHHPDQVCQRLVYESYQITIPLPLLVRNICPKNISKQSVDSFFMKFVWLIISYSMFFTNPYIAIFVVKTL